MPDYRNLPEDVVKASSPTTENHDATENVDMGSEPCLTEHAMECDDPVGDKNENQDENETEMSEDSKHVANEAVNHANDHVDEPVDFIDVDEERNGSIIKGSVSDSVNEVNKVEEDAETHPKPKAKRDLLHSDTTVENDHKEQHEQAYVVTTVKSAGNGKDEHMQVSTDFVKDNNETPGHIQVTETVEDDANEKAEQSIDEVSMKMESEYVSDTDKPSEADIATESNRFEKKYDDSTNTLNTNQEAVSSESIDGIGIKKETALANDVKEDENPKELNVIEKITDNGQVDGIVIANITNNKVDKDVEVSERQGPDDDKQTICMTSDSVSEDDNSSIQEALNKAHALLDSLSPMKSKSEPETYPRVLPHSPLNIDSKFGTLPSASYSALKDENKPKVLPGGSSKYQIPDTESLINDKEKVDSQTNVGSLTKTSSYGFAVSDILSDEVGKLSKDVDDSVAATAALLLPITTNTTTDPVNVAPQRVSSVTFPSSSESSPIIVDSSSSSQGCSSGLQTMASCLAPVLTFSAGLVPRETPLSVSTSAGSVSIETSPTNTSMIPGNRPQELGIVNNGTSFCSAGSTDVATVTQSCSVLPAISMSSSIGRSLVSVSDHGYSRAYNDMPRRSPYSASMGARSPGQSCSLVLHDPQSSASYIEIPMDMDMDDRSPLGKKAQKRKRPSLATEDIINYGKRRSARVSIIYFLY